jgi:hypothetical protein
MRGMPPLWRPPSARRSASPDLLKQGLGRVTGHWLRESRACRNREGRLGYAGPHCRLWRQRPVHSRQRPRRIFLRPVEPSAGEQSHRAAVEARVHAVAVELDFVQPAGSGGRRVDELRELRPYPFRQRGRSGAPGRYRSPHAGSGDRCRRMRLRISTSAYPSATARRAPTVSAAS